MKVIILITSLAITLFSASQAQATGGNSNNQKNNTINAGGSGNDTTSKAFALGVAVSESDSSAKAYGGNSKNTIKNHSTIHGVNKNDVNNRNTNGASSNQGQETNINIEQKAPDMPVNTATGTTVQINSNTCRSGVGGGAQGSAFGFSLGGTSDDENCEARMDAMTLHSMGFTKAALFRLCERTNNRVAIEATGLTCPVFEKKETLPTYGPNSP